MGRIHKINTTRLEIIQTATRLFFEKGFSSTTAAAICKEIEIGTGNLTFYFPTKDHILDSIVEMMCDFQWKVMEETTGEGKSSLLAYCMELTAMAAISEENEKMKEFYLATYTSPLALETVRANDLNKIKQVFGDYCVDWTEEQFVEAEVIVSGIEFATLMTTKHSASLPVRIEGALNSIMLLFGVPEELRRMKIRKVLAMDYSAIGNRVLCDFRKYTEDTTDQAMEELLSSIQRKNKI